jgi:hypothetical protein
MIPRKDFFNGNICKTVGNIGKHSWRSRTVKKRLLVVETVQK